MSYTHHQKMDANILPYLFFCSKKLNVTHIVKSPSFYFLFLLPSFPPILSGGKHCSEFSGYPSHECFGDFTLSKCMYNLCPGELQGYLFL